MHIWSLEKLAALSPQRLEVLRQNALKAEDSPLAALCADLQQSRRPKTSTPLRNVSPVIGFHFVCDDDYEVTLADGGKVWSGVWAIDQSHCDGAISMKGYVALHSSKRQMSYRQGTIVGWEMKERTKGTRQLGVSFLLLPFEEQLPWFGSGSGEKGYRRTSDSPAWEPKI